MLKKGIRILSLVAPFFIIFLKQMYDYNLFNGLVFCVLCILTVAFSVLSLFLDIFWTIKQDKEKKFSNKNKSYIRDAVILGMLFFVVLVVVMIL